MWIKAMNKQEVLESTRKALFETFGDYVDEDPDKAKRLIEENTYVGADAPGNWAPEALVVIIAECIPLPGMREVPQIDAWMEASDKIKGGFIGHINSAVAAVWPE
jgi:hypothetical protein